MSFKALRSPFLKINNFGAIIPTVVTNAATNITNTQADGNGVVVDDGGFSVTERGFVWSTNPNPTTADNKVTSGTGIGTYTATMTGLAAGTTYHYRAYAINTLGTAYGADVQFVTTGAGAAVSYKPFHFQVLGVG